MEPTGTSKHAKRWPFYLTIATTLFFLVLLHLSMWMYRGGTIHEPGLDTYSFTTNFISDLGRRNTPGGESNFPTNLVFRLAISLTGICILIFFSALPGVFKSSVAKSLARLAAVLGFVAGISYLGIAWVPYDVAYWGHRAFVRTGFITFLLMGMFYALAVFFEKGYPKQYGFVWLLFCLILFSQLVLMSYGDRSWRSNSALFQQATAQKVVVYAEILCILYQTFGVLGYLKKRQTI